MLRVALRVAFWGAVVFGVAVLIFGRTGSPPYRDLSAQAGPDCAEVYRAAETEAEEKREAIIKGDFANPEHAKCWTTPFEPHAEYDLFTVEFDDQGWLAGAGSDSTKAWKQIERLKQHLEELTETREPKDRRPLSIVLYTHGWHHSAAPADDNVIRFRGLLADTARFERALCLQKRGLSHKTDLTESACTEAERDEKVPLPLKLRRIVGIYVGWRGDSIGWVGAKVASIWDRKLTAEKVAHGSVQELYALLHGFWIEHACERREKFDKDCADVRMLVIGHSFGGLITYRALAPRLMVGIVETQRSKNGRTRHAYGFGDLAVLVNPAFEGTRFEPLAAAAQRREYAQGSDGNDAQLPVLLVVQSKGDVATWGAFPAFRFLTTLFETTDGAEDGANRFTVGWNWRYITHRLTIDSAYKCGHSGSAPIGTKLPDEVRWYGERARQHFSEFNAERLDFCDGLVAKKVSAKESGVNRPAFMPLWVLRADKEIVANHNDYLNPRLLDFVRQVYYTVRRATDHSLPLVDPNDGKDE